MCSSRNALMRWRSSAARALGGVSMVSSSKTMNRGFDNLYGLFPGAEGLQNLESIAPQVDDHANPYETLPRALDSRLRAADTKEGDPHPIDPRIPGNLPNRPFRLDPFIPLDAKS